MNTPKEYESTTYYQPMILTEDGLLKRPKELGEVLFWMSNIQALNPPEKPARKSADGPIMSFSPASLSVKSSDL